MAVQLTKYYGAEVTFVARHARTMSNRFFTRFKGRALIDKRFPLEQTTKAHRDVENGQKQGRVIVMLSAWLHSFA